MALDDIHRYFTVEPDESSLPVQSPFDVRDYQYTSNGRTMTPKLLWRADLPELDKHQLAVRLFTGDTYKEIAGRAKRAEEVSGSIDSHIWGKVNQHLGTKANSFPELVEQLGIMRFGHRPTVSDAFSGSGQIPFSAAQLGCDVVASDLNPVACMLTWSAFNLIGASESKREAIAAEQKELVEKVRAEIDSLGFESDGNGWKGKVYLYCLEVTCPSSGWLVPLLPTLVISKGKFIVAKLVPNNEEKRYSIELIHKATAEQLALATKGTVVDGNLIHVVDGVEHINSISSIRGDYVEVADGRRVTKNKLRRWECSDVDFRPSDVFRERLYAILWTKPNGNARPWVEFRAVTERDIETEIAISKYVSENLSSWQEAGFVPNTKIESGDKTDEPIRMRGWTHWHHLFNPRQLLTAMCFRKYASAEMTSGLTQILNINTRMSRWNGAKGVGRMGSVEGVFDNQALNPLYNFGCRGVTYMTEFFETSYKWSPFASDSIQLVQNVPANEVTLPSDIFVTDPPYGDAVKYEEILEFFIAWLRTNPPQEFSTWKWDSRRELAVKGEDHDFRLSMVAAYKRMAECMPDNGIQVLMFTHQSGNIWADMANIVWASGLRVTAAWYLVTETDSALRDGSYVKGTILLVLRKRLGTKRTNQTELSYELEEEVALQVKRLT